VLAQLIDELEAIRASCLEIEHEFEADLKDVHPSYRDSARNLLHYVALRRRDVRDLQKRLASLGLSSLGRTESHVLDNLMAVSRDTALPGRATLERDRRQEGPRRLRSGEDASPSTHRRAAGFEAAEARGSHSGDDAEPGRDRRVPDHDLVASGMNCMRINCAHDGPEAWAAMVAHLRAASSALGRECRILMDLAGPKLRTGPIAPEGQVLKWRPQRDVRGEVIRPAQAWLTAHESSQPAPTHAEAVLRIPMSWYESLADGDRIILTDLRGKRRRLTLQGPSEGGRWALSEQTAYLDAGEPIELQSERRNGGTLPPVEARIGELPADSACLMLHAGDLLVSHLRPHSGTTGASGRRRHPAPTGFDLLYPA
jgi:pyruvate kinase